MKMVTAIIQPFRLDDVVDALEAIGVGKFTVTEVRGIGRTKPERRVNPDEPPPMPLPPRIKIEVAVTVERLPELIEAIQRVAVTGRPGDGKIFVMELERPAV
jgi:nitrogen regulatory protein P-II 2